jgi:hypothetical protein
MQNLSLAPAFGAVGALARPPFVSFSRIRTAEQTVLQVCNALNRRLLGTDVEPEWLSPANTLDLSQTELLGARHADYWPVETATSRISVSVSRGVSDGYLVHVDVIVVNRTIGPARREVIELLRAKTFGRDHAQAVARAITRMLDVN